MVAVIYPKNQLKNFVGALSKILTIIKAETGKIFLPTVI
jgi:hypothetical protein